MPSWAYEFTSSAALVELENEFNLSGPWRWEMRDSDWYGDYLVSRPSKAVCIRIQEPQRSGAVGVRAALPGERRYWAQLDVGSDDEALRQSADTVFRRREMPDAFVITVERGAKTTPV